MEAERSDLLELRDDRRLVAALTHARLEAPEPLDLAERAPIAFVRGEVNEADAVLELERRIAEPVGPDALELCVHVADEFLVRGDLVGLDPVSNHDPRHRFSPVSSGNRSVLQRPDSTTRSR